MIKCIGHVTTDFRPQQGGAEVYVSDLMRALEPLANEQVVFQLDNSHRDPRLAQDNSLVLVPRLPGRWRDSRGHNLYAFNWRLKKKAFRERLAQCDLLIVSYPFHWPPVAWHPRVIVISHCVEYAQPPKTWRHRRRKKIAQRCDKEVLSLVANDTNFWREMGRDVPPKTHLWEAMAPRRWCLPNAIDPALFSPEGEPKLPERLRLWLTRQKGTPRPFILLARNASPARGIHLAIEALGQFASQHPDVALVVAGNPPSAEYQKVCDEAMKRLGIADRVCFYGHVARAEMPGLYRAASVAMVPSMQGEGTSLAALESMGCGTATISSDHGGLADLPTVQVKPDSALLHKALQKVWPQREEIGMKQCQVVREKFTMARWEEAWRGVVEEAMAAPAAGKR